jgi:hypothetical protein
VILLSDIKNKTIAIRVSDKEFEMYKKIAISLHNQSFFDDATKQHRPILQTTEPAEVLRFAIDGFVEKFTNPQYHHVILKLDRPAFEKWSNYAHSLSHSHTKDFFTGQPTQVLETSSLSELAFVGTNTFLQIIELSKMFKGVKLANTDLLKKH